MLSKEAFSIPASLSEALRTDEIATIVYIPEVKTRGKRLKFIEENPCPCCKRSDTYKLEKRRFERLSNGRLLIVESMYVYKCSTPDCKCSSIISMPVRKELREKIMVTPEIPIAIALQERSSSGS